MKDLIMPETLSIDLQASDDGKTHLFVLHGDLDVATSPSLRAALTEAASHGKHNIIVDLSRLDFLDSTGLGALIAADKQAKLREGEVRLVACEGQILRLLRITGLLDVFRVYPDIDAALLGSMPLVGM
jgi:anti-sigma B factor antagonist